MHFLRACITLQLIVALSRLPANIAPLAHNRAKGCWWIEPMRFDGNAQLNTALSLYFLGPGEK